MPITIQARKQGCSPQDIVDKYHKLIKDSFAGLGISFDIYSRTTSKTHYKTASEFFSKLYKDGKFIEKESEQYYDEEAGQFLADRLRRPVREVRLHPQPRRTDQPSFSPERQAPREAPYQTLVPASERV